MNPRPIRIPELDSRPGKEPVGNAEALRASWCRRAAELSVESLDLPAGQGSLPGTVHVDREAIVGQAVAQVAASSSSWLAADLAREIATLVPPEAAGSAADLVALVQELAAEAAGRCVELHRPSPAGTACRRDGRPVSKPVDRQLTTSAVWRQEARLLAWAGAAVGRSVPALEGDHQAAVARAVAGDERLVLVVRPAGAGKTTALGFAARLLADQGRPVLGLAPSGKAAGVLATETGWPATTLAKLLHEHARPDGPGPAWRLPAGTTVVLDEASMASTEDLDPLVALVQRHRWRLVAVGDPAQLPAVGRGGRFALWCERLPAHQLEEVRRFTDDWQAEASLALGRGDAAAAAAYAAHHRLQSLHPALVADRVARQFERLAGRGESVAISTASAGTAGPSTSRSNAGATHRTRGRTSSWPTAAAPLWATGSPPGATLHWQPMPERPSATARAGRSPRWATTARSPWRRPGRGPCDCRRPTWPATWDLGWAVTGYGSQGVTTVHAPGGGARQQPGTPGRAIAVVEPSTRGR